MSTKKRTEQKPIVKPGILYRTMPDGNLFVLSGDGAYYRIDGVSAEIFQFLAGGRPVPEIVRTLSKKYEVDEKMLIGKVRGFIRDLEEREIV